MNTFEAYHLYLALKAHFASDDYDFFKYEGKVNASPAAFEKRTDKYFFTVLAQHPDPRMLCVSNMVALRKVYIRDLVTAQENKDIYLAQKARVAKLTYTTKEQLSALPGDLNDWLKCEPNKHPFLLRQHLGGKVDIETLIVLDSIVPFFSYWNKKLKEDVVWPSKYKTAAKYAPFIPLESEHMMKNLKTHLLNIEPHRQTTKDDNGKFDQRPEEGT